VVTRSNTFPRGTRRTPYIEAEDGLLAAQDARGAGEGGKLAQIISHRHHIHITEILIFYKKSTIISFRELEK
jgi:hypothetical protein